MITLHHETHIYRKEDGTMVPSVTQILQAEGFIDPSWYTEEARERGSAVHEACEEIDQFNDPTIDAKWLPYVYAYIKFLHESEFDILGTERLVYSTAWGYAGTLDIMGYLNGHEAIIDRKTGAPAPWHGLQTAAYDMAEPGPTKRQRFGLYLRPNGTYSLVQHKERSDYSIFASAVAIHGWKRGHSAA